MTEGEAEAVFRFFGGVHGDGVMGELTGLVGKRQADEKGERDDQRHYYPAGGADDKCCQGAGFWCGAIGHGAAFQSGLKSRAPKVWSLFIVRIQPVQDNN